MTLRENMNMIKKNILLSAVLLATLSSCGIYTRYQPISDVPKNLFGEDSLTIEASDSISLGAMDWHDFFTDKLLQDYIERGLAQNTDYQSAMLKVEEASATLKAAKLAFLPAFALAPQAGVSSFDNAKAIQTYSVPITMSWEIDIFGRMRNAKEQAKALYAKSQDYQQAVRTQLIANIANTYYAIETLREQLSLSQQTEEAWQETLKTARVLMKVGRYDEAGINQMEATLHQVHTSVLDLQSQITQTENAMSILLGETPQHYATANVSASKQDSTSFNAITPNGNKALGIALPERFSIGVPLDMLSARPDVRQAQRSVEAAFYGVNQARSAFYPSLTLSGSVGWTNNSGAMIVNPGRLLASALGSLTAPILTRGQNEAQLKIAKAQQEEAKLAFTQTLLNAGKEVNDALTTYQTAKDKHASISAEVTSLEKALHNTTLMMEHGNNTYLEILTARQSLLSAQLSQSANNLSLVQSLINLYQALGGGQGK